MSEPPKPITRLARPEEMIDRSGPRRKNVPGRVSLVMAVLAWAFAACVFLHRDLSPMGGSLFVSLVACVAGIIALARAPAEHLGRTAAVVGLILSAACIAGWIWLVHIVLNNLVFYGGP